MPFWQIIYVPLSLEAKALRTTGQRFHALEMMIAISSFHFPSQDIPVGPVTLRKGPPSLGSQSALHTPSLAHVGYINPAFSQIKQYARSDSLMDLSLDDKLSHKSSKWGEEDEWDVNVPQDSGLHSLAVSLPSLYKLRVYSDCQAMCRDIISGHVVYILHLYNFSSFNGKPSTLMTKCVGFVLDIVLLDDESCSLLLQYGEEYDAASDRPISVLKEHTMFTDTHL